MKKLILRFALLPLVLVASRAPATTYTPTTTSDLTFTSVNSANGVITGGTGNGQVTLRSAFIAANAHAGADQINIPVGTYTLSLTGSEAIFTSNGAINDLDVTESLTIIGSSGNAAGDPNATIIQAGTVASTTGLDGNGIDKVIEINQEGNAGIHTTIAAVTIRNGKNTIAANSGDDLGGGITWYGSIVGGDIGSLTINNCVIANNVCYNNVGGGLSVDTGGNPDTVIQTNIIISTTTFSNNKAALGPTGAGNPNGGGGIALRGLSVTAVISDSTITGNTAGDTQLAVGGGIQIFPVSNTSAASVKLHHTVISNNVAAHQGGGIYLGSSSPNYTFVIDQSSRITGNTSLGSKGAQVSEGGGIYFAALAGTTLTIQDSVIDGNVTSVLSADRRGGAGLAMGLGNLVVSNTTISGNVSSAGAGGIKLGGGTASLIKATVVANNATTNGGGLLVAGGTLNMVFSRIVSNNAASASGVAQTAGTATVTNNWWGTNNPASLMSGTVGFTPWLQLTHTASPNQIVVPNSTTLTASFLTNSAGTFVPVTNLALLVGLPITFNNAVRGTLSGAQTTIQASGAATATFTATYAGAGSADAKVDNQTTTASITIPTGVSSINRVQTTPTNLSSVQWTVTFSNAVTGVAAGNFSLINGGLGGSPGITSVVAVGGLPATSWTVTASTGSGTGTLGLNMVNGTGVASIVNLPFTGQVYTIDLVAPDTSITAQPAALTNVSSASFSFTGSDTGVGVASFQSQLDGAAYTTSTSPVNFSGLANGSHTFNVRAIDGAGNTDASPATVTWTVDTIPPTVNCSTDVVVTANGYCPPVVNYTVSVSDNLAISLATTNPASGSVFPLGTNTVTLTARDTAGNTNFCTFKVIVLPGAAPQLTILRSSTNVIVSWTNLFPCYALQYAPVLASNSWSLYPGPFATNGGKIFVTNSAPFTNRFFRLKF